MATILIVDERPTNREYLLTLLGNNGHRLLQAADGAEALAIARAEHPTLILADILMPTMDGYEFVRQLHTNSGTETTPVIFCAAHYHEPQARALANACGVSHVLTKPVEPDVVLRTVEAALAVGPVPAPPSPTGKCDWEHLRLLTDKLSQNADELRRANALLTALVDLGLELGSDRDPRHLLQAFCHAAREIIGTKYAIVNILDSDGLRLRYSFTSGMDAETADRLGAPDPRQGGPGTVLREARCLRLHNPGGNPAAIDFPSSYPHLRSWLGAPIVSPGRVYGWVGLLNKVGAEMFSDEDERLAGILAAQMGRIYENGSIYSDMLRYAADLEREVAERKRAEQKLRIQGSALDAAANGIAITDVNGNVVWVNPAFTRMTGFEREEIIGQNPRALKSGQHDRAFYTELWQTILAGHVWHGEITNRRKDGTIYVEEQTITPVRDERGELTHFIAIKQEVTERKRAEAAAHQKELWVDNALDIITVLDQAGTILFENPACQRETGFSPQELVGRSVFGLIHPEDLPRVQAAIQRGLTVMGRIEILDLRFAHKDGSWIDLEARGLAFQEGDELRVLVNSRNITARKQAEARLRHVLSSSPAVLFTLAIAGDQIQGISWISDNLLEIFGYPPEAAFGKDWFLGNIHPDDRERIVAQTQGGLFSDGRLNHEYRFRHGDGSYRWTRGELRLIRDAAGQAVEVVGAWSDITEQKAAEEAYSKVQERLNGLFNSSGDGMVYATLDGLILDANNAYCQLTGYRRDELINNRRYQDLTPAQFHEAEAARVENILRTGKPEEYEKEYQRKDGKRVSISVTAFTVKNRQGHPVGLAGIVKDISQRKLLEEQFRQAQKMEAVGKLAGGVAHDFNNLLTVIMGYSDIYLNKLRPEDPLRVPLAEIHKAGERATGLTRQLLAFSRKQVLMPVVLDLNTIIADMDKMLRRLIGEDVTLTFIPGADLWKVKADPGQIEQVVMNIVVNARDAMPQGGKLLLETKNVELDNTYFQMRPEAKTGEHVLLAISDTGCGMDASVKSRIFEPFFTTKSPTKGTGLGLATVFGIVKQSGGHIEVYSEVGQGATFKVYLPRSKSGESFVKLPQTKEPVRGGNETILLVEDEDGVRNLAQTVLQLHGYSVLDARNGGDALLICETHSKPIDLMITDVVMPHFSGRQLAERLATRQPTMKVLYMSGYTDDAIVHHGVLESGMPFLQKPFAPETLARKVREVLDNNRGQKSVNGPRIEKERDS